MGLLDEAIREHLELKRLRGADPGEIARLEREALGPVRRGGDSHEESPPQSVQELADAGADKGPDVGVPDISIGEPAEFGAPLAAAPSELDMPVPPEHYDEPPYAEPRPHSE